MVRLVASAIAAVDTMYAMEVRLVPKLIRLAAFALSVLLLPLAAVAAQTRYQLQVDGLACPFCAYGIEKQLTRMDGVDDIEVDINAGTVTVTMAAGTAMTKDQASQVVKDAGFTLREFTEVPAQD